MRAEPVRPEQHLALRVRRQIRLFQFGPHPIYRRERRVLLGEDTRNVLPRRHKRRFAFRQEVAIRVPEKRLAPRAVLRKVALRRCAESERREGRDDSPLARPHRGNDMRLDLAEGPHRPLFANCGHRLLGIPAELAPGVEVQAVHHIIKRLITGVVIPARVKRHAALRSDALSRLLHSPGRILDNGRGQPLLAEGLSRDLPLRELDALRLYLVEFAQKK